MRVSDRSLRFMMRAKGPAGFLAGIVCAPMNVLLGAVESSIAVRQSQPKWPPIFIVGPPRSGTTLLYQAMSNALAVCYVNNLTNFASAFPALVTLAAKPLVRFSSPGSYASRFGLTGGWNGPNTATRLWKRWFADGRPHIAEVLPNKRHGRRMIGAVSLIERIHRMPFVNKWTSNSARVPELGRSFPRAVFVRVRRDYLDVADSMLDARRRLRADPHAPLTPWPRGFEQPRTQHYTRCICEHLRKIEAAIDHGKRVVGEERFFEVEYERFCESPREVIASFREYYAERSGYYIPWRGEIPGSFERRRSRKIGEADYRALRECLLELGMGFRGSELGSTAAAAPVTS